MVFREMDIAQVALAVVAFCFRVVVWLRASVAAVVALKDVLVRWLYVLLESVVPRRRIFLPKIPKHLAVLFTERCGVSERTVVDIATHSVMYGIDELSVYDPWSMLKGEQQNICARVEKRVARLQSNQKVKPVPLQLSVNGEQSHKNTSLNLHINFLGAEDGRGSLVRAARDLCSSGVRSEDVTVQLIGDSLRRLSVSEPELLLIFGAVDSLAGYPPWALRVTEFVSMPNRRQMTEFEFVECLEQLSGRDQRFGR